MRRPQAGATTRSRSAPPVASTFPTFFAILLLTLAPAAWGQPFGESAKAKRAFEAGRLEEALGRYRVILAAHPEPDAKRGEAIWHIALIRLGAEDPAIYDAAAGCRLLDELADAYQSTPHEIELRALRGLCAGAGARQDRVSRLEEQLATARQATSGAQQDALSKERERERLAGEAAALKQQLAAAKAELARQEIRMRQLTGAALGRPD